MLQLALICLFASGSCFSPIPKPRLPIFPLQQLVRHPHPCCIDIKSEQQTRKPKREAYNEGWSPQLPGADLFARLIDRPQIELFNAFCVASSLLLFALQTLELSPDVRSLLRRGEDSIAVGFFIEYLVRWYSRNLNPRHIADPLILLDLFSFLPSLLRLLLPIVAGLALQYLGMSNDPTLVVLYGQAWRMLDAGLGAGGADFIFLRFVRLIRLQRFLKDNESFSNLQLEIGIKPMSIKPWQLQLARAGSSIFALLIISAGCIYEAEPQVTDCKHTQSGSDPGPAIRSARCLPLALCSDESIVQPPVLEDFTSLYYAVQTLTNGNDGIVPETTEGRYVVTGSILAGIAIIPLQVSQLAKAYFQREQDSCVLPDGDDLTDMDELSCVFQPGGVPAFDEPAELNVKAQADLIAKQVLLQLEEEAAKLRTAREAEEEVEEEVDTACGNCGAVGHRADAKYCYRCSTRLSDDVERIMIA